jgi:hypothetical protein
MISLRRAARPVQFAVAVGALSSLAWLQTFVTGLAGRAPRDYPIFDRLFIFTDDWGAALQVAIVVLVAASGRIRSLGARLAAAIADRPIATATVAFVVFACGAKFVYHAMPFAMDEYAQLSQAYAFAHGHLSWIEPPDLLDRLIPSGFRDYFFVVDPESGRVASKYWPGFAVLLAPFAWLGVPWIVNPLLSAATLLVLYRLVLLHVGSREAAGWAMVLALSSPEFSVNAISYYAMPAHLLLNLLFAAMLLDGRRASAFVAGLLGGLALVLHNPVPHALFALPWLLWLLWSRRRWPMLLAVVAGYVPIGLLLGLAWPAYLAGFGSSVIGFSQAVAPTGAWTLLTRALAATFMLPSYEMVCARLYATWKIWIWSAPGVLILAVAGYKVVRGPLRLLAASALVTYCVFWFVPLDQGHGWGYRYFHTAWGVLPIFGGALIAAQPLATPTGAAWRQWVGGIALASAVLATTLRFAQVDEIMDVHLAQRIEAPSSGRWVVFVRYEPGLYTWDMIQNLPFASAPLILMSLGESEDAALMAGRFPGAIRTVDDRRGSLWRLGDPPDSSAER